MSGVVPILSIAESRNWERQHLFSDDLEREALHCAGHRLAAAIHRDVSEIIPWPEAPRVLLLAGKGHNTGDALIAVGDLLKWHPRMQVVLLWEGDNQLRPLTAEVWDSLQKDAGYGKVEECLLSAERQDNDAWVDLFSQEWTLLIDAVFGMGFRPPLPPHWQKVARIVNACQTIQVRVSVDMPSGMGEQDSDEEVIRADFTYAMGIAKEPLFRFQNMTTVGRIRFLDIGFFQSDWEKDFHHTPLLLVASILDPLRMPRKITDDKRHHGRVGIVAGSRHYPGAPLLTTLGALQVGAGLVTSVVPEHLVPALAARAPEAIWMEATSTPEGSISLEMLRDILAAGSNWNTLVIGPGLGRNEETFCLVGELVKSFSGSLVLDADALREELRDSLCKRPREYGPVILLPHAGEWQRLRGVNKSGDAADFENEMITWSREFRTILVCKGPVTRLTNGLSMCYSTRGGPVLGRGGSGDILAGMMGALLARYSGMYDPLQIAGMAVYWHGRAAEQMARVHGENAVRNAKLPDYLASVLRDAFE